MENLGNVINRNYQIQAEKIDLLSDHGAGKAYKVTSSTGLFVLKQIPSFVEHPENEGPLTQYLLENEINAPRMHKTVRGAWIAAEKNGARYQLHDYVDGTVHDINTAPDWLLRESAAVLGKIHAALRGYQPLPAAFTEAFFGDEMARIAEKSYKETLRKARKAKDLDVARDVEMRISTLKSLANLPIDYDRLTKGNSHGDYWIGQLVDQDHKLFVLDWTDAACIPLCLEVIMSYTYADPKCADGTIDAARLIQYVQEYAKYNQLTPYDLESMPYVYAFWIGVLNFYEPYTGLPDEYLRIAKLCTRLLGWLERYARDLSSALRAAFA